MHTHDDVLYVNAYRQCDIGGTIRSSCADILA